ncbi:MAG: hypothetical protein U0528_21015 [Anaerolineae bacterium]
MGKQRPARSRVVARSQRYYVVHDISKSNFGVTPYLANTIRDLYALRVHS